MFQPLCKEGRWKTDGTTKKLLKGDVEERPATIVPERHRFLQRATGKALSESTVKRLLTRLGFSKKWAVRALDRDE